MRNLLLTMLSLSLSGSLVALALFALRPLCRRYLSKRCRYYIWILVLARLLLPVGPPNNLMQLAGERFADTAVLSTRPQPASQQIAPTVQIHPDAVDVWEFDEENSSSNSGSDQSAGGGSLASSLTALELIGALWLGIAAVLLLRKLISYTKLVREIKRSATPCQDAAPLQLIACVCRELGISLQPAVYTHDYLPSPMLVGLFRPFIAIPTDCTAHKDLRYILYHELVHFKRRDILYKWAAQVTVYLHWFNPVVYLVQREIGHCCELACDEAVVRRMADKDKGPYGEAILAAIKPTGAKQYTSVSLPMSEDKQLLKERLVAIMGYTKKSRWVAGLAAMLTVVLLCGTTYAGAYAAPRQWGAKEGVMGAGAQVPGSALSVGLGTAAIMGETWYLIDNEHQLRGLGRGDYPLGGKYLLNADITLDKSVDWIPIGTQQSPFTGAFNGNGFEIVNLTITQPAHSVIGMFAYAENAHIYNVTLRNPDIEGAFVPGNSIAPILVFGKNCRSHDNQIVDPVERDSAATIGNTSSPGASYTGRTQSLIQDFAPYAPYGVIYNPDTDHVIYNGELVKIFAVFKPDRSAGTTYAFDLFYRDRDADSRLYLEAVRDASGRILEVRRLDDTLAADLLIDLEDAHDSRAESKQPDAMELQGPHNFDATFNWVNRGISATDKFGRDDLRSAVTDWLKSCDRQQGAYILQTEPSGGKTTYYLYYNGGGRYPWMLHVEEDQLVIELYSNSHLATSDGYHLMNVTVSQGYSYSAVKLRLDGVELELVS